MNRRIEKEGTSKNLCATFILPMIGINYKTLPDNFINCYINDDYEVILVFDKIKEDVVFYDFLVFAKSLDKLVKYEENVDEYILHFKILDYNKVNYDLFKEGKYSKFSENYKQAIVAFFEHKVVKKSYHATEYDIIYPTTEKRKQVAERLGVDIKDIIEVFDAPDLTKEIYKSIEQIEDTINDELRQ